MCVVADWDAVRAVPRRHQPLAGGVCDGRRRVGRGARAVQLHRPERRVGRRTGGRGRAERGGRVVMATAGDDSFGGVVGLWPATVHTRLLLHCIEQE